MSVWSYVGACVVLGAATVGCGNGSETADARIDIRIDAEPDANDHPRDGDPPDAMDKIDGTLWPDSGPQDAPVVTVCTAFGARQISQTVNRSSVPALLWDGMRYLVVWADQRTPQGYGDIRLARLSAAGVPLSANEGGVIAGAMVPAKSPEVLPMPAGGYVVVFEGCEGFVTDGCPDGASVKSILLDGDGAPAGGVHPLSEGKQTERRPQTVSAFGRIYLTYRDTLGAHVVVKVAALDAAGSLAASPQPLDIVPAGQNAEFPDIAYNGSHLAVAYVEGTTHSLVKLALLDASLTVVTTATFRTGQSARATNTNITWAGDEWLVAWEDERKGEARVWITAVSADGLSIRPPYEVYNQNGNWPLSAWNGNSALLVFYGFPAGGNAQVFGQQINAAFERAGPYVALSMSSIQNARFPDLVWNPENGVYGLVFEDRNSQQIVFSGVACP